MLIGILLLVFFACLILGLAFTPISRSSRPTLNIDNFETTPFEKRKPASGLSKIMKGMALVNKPLVGPDMRRSLMKRLAVAQSDTTPEEFLLIKEALIVVFLIFLPSFLPKEMFLWGILMSLAFGYYIPEFMLTSRVKKVKEDFIKLLPDTVDLLGLCVNAGLDFMMALKWVVEKSAPNVVVNEMGTLLQEINVGKPRREALRDLAKKYELPDLATFSRTLIQADKMGTSVSEALNILSEDMRLARYRRGEAMALKAPIKLLVPLLFCIFPVVGLLVGGPIFLDFMMNNPLKNLAH